MKPSMYSIAISGPRPAGRSASPTRRCPAASSASCERDGAAERMADEMGARRSSSPPSSSPTAAVMAREIAGADILARAAMAGQVDGVGGRSSARASWLNSQLLRSPPKPWMSTIGAPLAAAELEVADAAAAGISTISGSGFFSLALAASCALKRLVNSATKASISPSPTLGVGDHASSAPTGSVSPSATTFRRSTPATGLSKTLAIFEVSMSMISWPLAIVAPSSTARRRACPPPSPGPISA